MEKIKVYLDSQPALAGILIISYQSQVPKGLDNCAYNRPFDDQRQMRIFLETQAKLHIQHLITDKKLALACSYMSVYENSSNPHEDRQFSIEFFFNHSSQFVDYDKAEEVEEKATIIMECGIKNKDAIHLAAAIEAECDYFITTDDDLAKKYTGNDIRIINPVDFIKILEEQEE